MAPDEPQRFALHSVVTSSMRQPFQSAWRCSSPVSNVRMLAPVTSKHRVVSRRWTSLSHSENEVPKRF